MGTVALGKTKVTYLSQIISRLLSPLGNADATRLDGEFEIWDRKFTFKAYTMQSKKKGHPVDLIRIDVKGE